MILRILRSSLAKFWDKIGLSFLSSLLAGLNPFFFLFNLILMQLFRDTVAVRGIAPEYLTVFLVVALCVQTVFPTTLMCLQMQKELAEGEIVYIKNYFADLWPALRKIFLPSLALTGIFGTAGFFIANAALFYIRYMPAGYLRYAFLSALLAGLVFLMLLQFVLVPVFLYRERPGILRAFRYAAGAVLSKFPVVASVAALDGLLLAALLLLNGTSQFLYFALSGYFRIYLYSELSGHFRDFPWPDSPRSPGA